MACKRRDQEDKTVSWKCHLIFRNSMLASDMELRQMQWGVPKVMGKSCDQQHKSIVWKLFSIPGFYQTHRSDMRL